MKPSLVSADTALVRRLNTRAVLLALRSAGEATLTQLAGTTGLSRQTTAAALDELIARGLGTELAPVHGSSGRPARRYRFRPGAAHVVGLSIAPNHVLVIVADLDGTTVAQHRAEASNALTAPDRLALAERVASGCVATTDTVWAAAVGTSGVIDPAGRVRVSSQMPGWTGLDLADTISGWFGCPAFAGNDASYAALAEQWRGNAQYVRDVVYLLTGHRSGYGLVIEGRVHKGRSGAAGEFGGLPYLHGHDPSIMLAEVGATANDVFAQASDGDAEALDLVDRMAAALARSASVMVMAVDPDLVVVGGDFMPAGRVLLTPLRRNLGRLCLSPPEVAMSAHGEEAVALGAVRVALDHVEASSRMLGSPAADWDGRPPAVPAPR